MTDDCKDTNPKSAIGDTKIPFSLWPETATALGALGLMDGMLKYGRSNWRPAGARASTYYNAARRHLNAWFEGEDADPDSGLDHLAHALACLAIVVDARAAGKLEDDRCYAGGYRKTINELTPHVERLKKLHAHRRDVKHYTVKDCGNITQTSGTVLMTDPELLAALRLHHINNPSVQTVVKETYAKDPQTEW